MGIHQRIVQFSHYVCRQLAMESPHDTNRLWYFTSNLIYMDIKSKSFITCNDKEFDGWNFRKDWFSNFSVESVFLVGDYHYEILLTFREILLVLSQLSTPTSYLFTVAWTLLMSLSDSKTVVSSAKWTKRIWFEDLCMALIYKRKSTRPNTEPCGTPNVIVWHRGTEVFG